VTVMAIVPVSPKPGLDVVWFSNPGSALVTRMSRVVAVSAVSGVAGLDVVWLPNLGSALVSWLSRLVVVSAASVVFGVSGHSSVLQTIVSSRAGHVFPLYSGSWTTSLLMVLVPPPQVALHLPHDFQLPTLQSTGTVGGLLVVDEFSAAEMVVSVGVGGLLVVDEFSAAEVDVSVEKQGSC